MAIKQTRIFVPTALPFDDNDWCETLVGSVIIPLVSQTDWFWFSRYIAPRTDSGDCDINIIPEEYGINRNGQRLYRSLRFRYQIPDEKVNTFETDVKELIKQCSCVISDFRPYPMMDDLGGDRFIGGERSQQRRIERAELVVQYLCAISQIFIHSLEGPDDSGKFHLEVSDSRENPHGSIFESLHHILCNITNVPLRVLVSQHGIGTDWSPPLITEGATVKTFEITY